jgi:hypothetical protein
MIIDVLIANVKDRNYRGEEFESGNYHFIYSPMEPDKFHFLEDAEMIETLDEKDGYTLKTFKDRGDECVFTLPNGHTYFVTIHDNRLLQPPK